VIRPQDGWRRPSRASAAETIRASQAWFTGKKRRISVIDEEEYGGDPPCWAHLFDEETTGMDVETEDRAASSDSGAPCSGAGQLVNLAALAHAATVPGAVWTHQSEDLDVNLLLFAAGEGVAEHVNDEVDVLLVAIVGEGAVAIDGKRQFLGAGHAIVIPKGARRSTAGTSAQFAYLTCHRRRGGLQPGR
jgi:mannose-6-phosphate isomerase-like protein (cupin superfamily)